MRVLAHDEWCDQLSRIYKNFYLGDEAFRMLLEVHAAIVSLHFKRKWTKSRVVCEPGCKGPGSKSAEAKVIDLGARDVRER